MLSLLVFGGFASLTQKIEVLDLRVSHVLPGVPAGDESLIYRLLGAVKIQPAEDSTVLFRTVEFLGLDDDGLGRVDGLLEVILALEAQDLLCLVGRPRLRRIDARQADSRRESDIKPEIDVDVDGVAVYDLCYPLYVIFIHIEILT